MTCAWWFLKKKEIRSQGLNDTAFGVLDGWRTSLNSGMDVKNTPATLLGFRIRLKRINGIRELDDEDAEVSTMRYS